MTDDNYRLQERFDRHLEIYAQNGKELAALKSEVKSSNENLQRSLTTIHDMIRENTKNNVTHVEFRPIKLLVYGCVAIMLSAVVAALVALVVI